MHQCVESMFSDTVFRQEARACGKQYLSI